MSDTADSRDVLPRAELISPLENGKTEIDGFHVHQLDHIDRRRDDLSFNRQCLACESYKMTVLYSNKFQIMSSRLRGNERL